MSESNSTENPHHQSLSLQALLAKILDAPAQSSTRRFLPITGTMQWLNEQLVPSSFFDGINATLRGIGQVIFCNNPLTGLIFLVATFIHSPWVGLCGLLGAIASTITAIFLKVNIDAIRNGVWGFNGTLGGLAVGTFSLWGNGNGSPLWAFAVIILAILTTILANTLRVWITTYFKISILGIPFHLITLLFYGAILYIPQPLFELGSPPISPPITSLDGLQLLFSFPRSFGSILFSLNLISSLLILTGVFICSPISAGMGLMGALISAIVAIALGIDLQSVYLGLWELNSVLTAIALGGIFYAPLPRSIGIALLASFVCAWVHWELLLVFAPLGLPPLALAFTITTMGAFFIVKHSIPSLVPVALYTITCPEEHYKRYQIAKEIIVSFRYQLQEAIVEKTTFLLFQKASAELKGDLRYIFNAIDSDRNEKISLSELKTYLRLAHDTLLDTEINDLFNSIDLDNSGKIDFEEFGELILRHQRLTTNYNELVTYFIPIDDNEDGLIDSAEMNRVLQSVGEPPLFPQEIKFLKHKTGYESLTWHQFIDLLLVI